MTNIKKLTPAAVIALKEALAQIYWYKKDLRTFLIHVLTNPSILSSVNWEDYKRNITDSVVETLARNQDKYGDELLKLLSAVASMDDFSHLEYLEDGERKAERARSAVEALRKYALGHEAIWREQEQAHDRRSAYAEKIDRIGSFQKQLQTLNTQYCQLVTWSNVQERGYRLEDLLHRLFDLFDLDPKASFRIEGEQIDGAFSFDGTDYLFEAKWQNELVRADALDSLASKIIRKLDNTLGLFLAINGFSSDGIVAHSAGRKVLLLVDGADVMAVLDARIALPDLLRRKRRHASQTGEIYLRFQDML
jgi:hypothetical protein